MSRPILHRLQTSLQRRISYLQSNPKVIVFGIGIAGLGMWLYRRSLGLAVSDNSDRLYSVRTEAGGKQTGIISKGDLAAREETWKLRNLERNHSIMTQDYHRQLDDAQYRQERLKDNDYLRYPRED